jgi:hypothetical protein
LVEFFQISISQAHGQAKLVHAASRTTLPQTVQGHARYGGGSG